jgi:hypothetical protein
MATVTRFLLSASNAGQPIPITNTASPGTLIHTAINSTAGYDEIYAWFTNVGPTPVNCTIQWGGTVAPNNEITNAYVLPPNSQPIPLLTGQCIQNALNVSVYAGVTNQVVVTGYCNRIL